MTKKIVAALMLLSLCACPGQAAGSPHPAPPDAELFQWEMPSGFGANRDDKGRTAETQPWEVSEGPWTIVLTVGAKGCVGGARYEWEIEGKRVAAQLLGPCRFSYQVPHEGQYSVHLVATTPSARREETQRVDVQDWLIVSIGDSVASGEGVPEASGSWQSARCHRSALSGTALAAKRLEEDDRHSSVTFVHLACSGAEVPQGLIGPYKGAIPPDDEPPLPPQVGELNRIAAHRPVDAVLLSIGANDIHFSDLLFFCAKHPFSNCFRHTYTGPGGDRVHSAASIAAGFIADLPRRYDSLARAISNRIPPRRVHIVEYFDPTRNGKGRPCGRLILDVFRPNVEQAESRLLAPLNAAVAAAARQHDWDEVGGVADLFRTHGICAKGQAWVSSLPDSLLRLNNWVGRHRGALHPNDAGHEETSRLISRALKRDLYGGRALDPQKLTEPDGGAGKPSAGGGGKNDAIDKIGAVAEIVFFAVAALMFSFALSPLLPVGYLVCLGWDSGSPILLGLLLATPLLFQPSNIRHLLRPFRALARSLRPLLLPLMVILAVGTVKWSPPVQILITAALLLIGWRAIVVPEAGRASVNLAFERALARKVVKHVAVAVLGGLIAVLILGQWVLPSTAYFRAIGDVASGLLLLGLGLWLVAIGLRLVSHATSRLRAVVAVLLGLCLLIFAMAFGLLPWGGGLEDAWPSLLGFLGGCALLALLVEAARYLIADPSKQTEGIEEADPPQTFTGGMRGLGFSAAASASLVLAISTGYGLIDAADKGRPLNPPEEDSASAVIPAVGTTPAGDSLELTKRYAPVLVFTGRERWTPLRVGSYVARATLSGPAGTPSEGAAYRDLPACPQSKTQCYTLSINCPSGSEECAHALHREVTERDRDALHKEGAVYVRAVSRDRLPRAQRQAVFGAGGPFGARLASLLQYWYFYEYDEWEAPVFAGLLTQRHEGDWEAVTLGLDPDRRPLFVAYSAHCAGTWRYWKDIEVSTLPPGPRVHPLVAVAEGSHANYPAAEQKRSPDWASCAGVAPAGVTSAISFASNIRDKTEYAWPWYPAPDGWIRADAAKSPMSFKGSWGADDRTTLRNFKSNPLGDPDHGPFSPPLQKLWREPVALIFCGKYTPRKCKAQ